MKKNKNQEYIIKQTDVFIEELNEILQYMRYNFYSLISIKFLKKIIIKLENLKIFPKMYSKYYKNPKYRRFLINNYIVFYKVDDKNKIVNIVHIYYSRKNSFNLN